MARQIVTVSHTVRVDRTPEEVFDYTQDYATRSDWDPTVKSAEVLARDPRRVRVTAWTQTSTLEFRNGLVGWLLAPLIRRNMATLTRQGDGPR